MSLASLRIKRRGAALLATLLATLAGPASGGCAADPVPDDDAALAGAAATGAAAAGEGGTAGGGSIAGAGVPSAGVSGAAGSGGEPAPPTAGDGEQGAPVGDSDDIFGVQVPRSDAFWVAGGRVHQGDRELTLAGLNWFGLETETLALFGPIEARRGVHEFVAQVQELGFNALRVPLSPEAIHPGNATASWAARGEVDTGLEQLEELARAAVNAGVYLLLDMHTCSAHTGFGAGAPDDPACGGYSEDDWVADLTTLAGWAEGYAPWVVGVDLFNEPHALDWARWRAMVERGGEAVLRENPYILVFVGGVGSQGYSGSDAPFWGENLTLALSDAAALPESRVVYAPHVYGPSVAGQSYFDEAAFPGNMAGIWDEHFGYLMGSEQALVVGEFGGRYAGADREWQDAFVDYLEERRPAGFFYWALNPNSGDTGGLLLDDWRSVDQDKLALLSRLLP